MDNSIPQVQQETNQAIPQQPIQSPQTGGTSSLKRIILILTTVILLLAIVGGAYLLGTKNNNSKTVSQITPTATATPTPTSDPTANWKTYTNPKYGYSIKYPADWIEQVKCRGGIAVDDYICFKSPDFTEDQQPNITSGGLITIDGNSQGSSFTAGSIDNFCQSRPLVTILECTQIKVDNISAIKRVGNDQYEDIGIIKNGKFIISIRVEYTTSSKTQILKQFDQILSTFKFIN